MGRLSTTLAAAAAGDSVAPVLLVSLAFPSGTQYLSDLPQASVSFGGQTYSGNGVLQAVSAVHERADGRVGSVRLTLAATTAIKSAVLSDALQFADVQIAWGFLSGTTGALLDAESLGTFFMSTPEYDIGAGLVELTVEPVAIRLLRTNMVMASNADQGKRYSGDTFFTHVAALEDKELEWGGEKVVFHTTGGGGGGVTGINVFGFVSEADYASYRSTLRGQGTA